MSIRLSNPMTALVWLSVLVPGWALGGRVETAFGVAAVAVAALSLWALPCTWESLEAGKRTLLLFGLLQALAVFSYMYSCAFNGVQTGPEDWLALPRWTGFGLLAVYVLRQYDETVRAALEGAAVAGAWLGWLVFREGELGYASVLCLFWLLFIAKGRRRLPHAAAACAGIYLSGSRPAWAVGLYVLSAALSLRLGDVLLKRRVKHAARLSFLAFALSLAGSIVLLRSQLARPEAPGAPRSVSASMAWDAVKRSPVLGWGPASYEAASSVQNQYLLWLLRGGAVSALLLLAGLGTAAAGLVKDADEDLRRLPGVAVFVSAVGLLLMAGPFLESWRLFLLTGFFARAVHEGPR